jgi:hypothetical protein
VAVLIEHRAQHIEICRVDHRTGAPNDEQPSPPMRADRHFSRIATPCAAVLASSTDCLFRSGVVERLRQIWRGKRCLPAAVNRPKS